MGHTENTPVIQNRQQRAQQHESIPVIALLFMKTSSLSTNVKMFTSLIVINMLIQAWDLMSKEMQRFTLAEDVNYETGFSCAIWGFISLLAPVKIMITQIFQASTYHYNLPACRNSPEISSQQCLFQAYIPLLFVSSVSIRNVFECFKQWRI